jgi:hypothetical protein
MRFIACLVLRGSSGVALGKDLIAAYKASKNASLTGPGQAANLELSLALVRESNGYVLCIYL